MKRHLMVGGPCHEEATNATRAFLERRGEIYRLEGSLYRHVPNAARCGGCGAVLTPPVGESVHCCPLCGEVV